MLTSVVDEAEGEGVWLKLSGGRVSPRAARASTAVDVLGWELLSESARLDGAGDGCNDCWDSLEILRNTCFALTKESPYPT